MAARPAAAVVAAPVALVVMAGAQVAVLAGLVDPGEREHGRRMNRHGQAGRLTQTAKGQT